MVDIINIVLLLILTVTAIITLFSNSTYFKLNANTRVLLTGPEKFLLLTILTGMFRLGGTHIGSLDTSAWRLLIWIALMILAFIVYRKNILKKHLILLFFIFLFWMFTSLLWSNDLLFGIRVFLKYLYPFVILLFASSFVKSDKFILIVIKYSLVVAIFYSLVAGGIMWVLLGSNNYILGNIFWPRATLADYLSVVSSMAFLLWWVSGKKKYLLLILWFIITSMLSGTRTGILSTFTVILVGLLLRYKLKALPYMFIGIVSFISAFFYIPALKEKMFFQADKFNNIMDLLQISTADIRSNARFSMWEWMINKYFIGAEFIGSGVGTVQARLYKGDLFGGLEAVHGDYIQLICDTGLIGLVLYFLFVFSCIINAKKMMKKAYPDYIRSTAIIGILSISSTMTSMIFDNVVNYAFAVHSYPFIFLGILLAYQKNYKQGNRNEI